MSNQNHHFPTSWGLLIAVILLISVLPLHSFADEGTNHTLAILGGETAVSCQENGLLETSLTLSKPAPFSKFRYLCAEGDTVFEQFRQLNFPSWDQQLSRVKATSILCMFGQMESLDTSSSDSLFIKAYEAILDRLPKNISHIILVSLTPLEETPRGPKGLASRNEARQKRSQAIRALADRRSLLFVNAWEPLSSLSKRQPITSDGIHLNPSGQWTLALEVCRAIGAEPPHNIAPTESGLLANPMAEALRKEIIEKNRLWFNYWRPQNWAFLNGDRTEQPSSRDHLDPKKRWFPAEMEEYLPLIADRESKIQSLTQRFAINPFK